MAPLPGTPRVGRSQGVSIFWGLVSVFFAAAACFYFWTNHENEAKANILRDQVMTLQEQSESLSAEKNQLQSGMAEQERQLKLRQDFLQEKETKLAAEETRLEAQDEQAESLKQQSAAQAAVVKKFDDTVRKLVKDDTDVVLRGGRPVLRVPESVFFNYGEAMLKPEGKALLAQLTQTLAGQMDDFELRVECYTDSEGELEKPPEAAAPTAKTEAKTSSAKTPAPKVPATNAPAAAAPRFASGWDLTAARAAAIARYLRDQGTLPFANVLVSGRGDALPIVQDAKDHARNRRVEITITPQPAAYHPPEGSAGDASGDKPKKSKGEKPDAAKTKIKPDEGATE